MTTHLHSAKSHIESIPVDDRPVYQDLLNTEENLSKKCDGVAALDKKINKMSARIAETSYEVENRSLARRVGYGFAGIAIALLCPISWGLAVILGVGLNADGAAFLYKAPVKLCGKLFAKAIGSKEEFKADLNKFTEEKTILLSQRITAMDEVDR
jgi:hypothetical protein